jgi:peptide chain release factor 2
LEDEAASPNFWKDNEKAAGTMKELEILKEEINKLDSLEKNISDLDELVKIGSTKDVEELGKSLSELEKDINHLEFKTLFSGKYDRNDAILAIHAGAGGVDAQDWAEMLLRMYLRFAEKNNFEAKILDESRGGEAGMKSVVIEIVGPYAFGNLRSEAGVHRLVRLSPFNADNLRQTSFALVEVLPVIGEMKEVVVKPE